MLMQKHYSSAATEVLRFASVLGDRHRVMIGKPFVHTKSHAGASLSERNNLR